MYKQENWLFITILVLISACTNPHKKTIDTTINKKVILTDNTKSKKNPSNLLTDYSAINEDGSINVIIEIPCGTREKWEVDKSSGTLKLELIDSQPRIVNYLPYPCNYGMIPKTLLPKELGGDNDPLDVMVLGDPIERGTVVKCKIIGVLKLRDRNKQDDKLIAVKENSAFYEFDNVEKLDKNYNGILDILELWFSNYKGACKMESLGFSNKKEALKILKFSIESYKTHN